MKSYNDKVIIGIDHGYGNIKTANHYFPTGITAHDSEPLFTKDMLIYNGKYYLIGEGHKEFLPEKQNDEDYYVLTLAAIATELTDEGLTEADVIIAAGLPLTWTSGQKAAFAIYLSKNKGYSAVVPIKSTLKGLSMVAGIGNGTMNTLYLVNGRPQSGKMFTEKFGTYQCTLAIREGFMRKTRRELNDFIIDEVLRTGTADIPDSDLEIITAIAEEYVTEIFRRLREHGYDESTMKLCVCGGGGCLIRNFYRGDLDRVKFIDDICAAAKGYEYLADVYLRAEAKNEGRV